MRVEARPRVARQCRVVVRVGVSIKGEISVRVRVMCNELVQCITLGRWSLKLCSTAVDSIITFVLHHCLIVTSTRHIASIGVGPFQLL